MPQSARYAYPDAIVSTAWLADNLADPSLRIFDCTTYLRYETGTGRPYRVENGREDYDRGHIPGSAYLDLQGELSDPSSRYNFMMPEAEDLAARFARKGVGDGTRVILYARKSPQWATRIWWMLRSIGFDDAAVLDGGFDLWEAEGRPTETAETRYEPATLAARPRAGLFVGKDEVKNAIGDGATCTINALAPDLHQGDNPRYGRPGRVPGSVNVPAAALVDAGALTFKSPEEAAELFQSVGADKSKSILLYCGGGIAATLDAFLLHQLGYANIAVYDASMSEWAKDETLPIERG
ncbi:thiosulfate/3-mercaptopyruvate sulfurtransferase [Enterovirga rhinocerotis]|uniref:Thiosulfate/3-mercaptopyruvate sulfurtransferase n=2 Tax=Enterovirga rhinocerotis TaxID=1339210 RepID=A0A4R7BYT0_9HYPH|nr:thiosulfate/3-mercaptopyruvate sulfurtransferase [Enterovirga rhinocerotis]